MVRLEGVVVVVVVVSVCVCHRPRNPVLSNHFPLDPDTE